MDDEILSDLANFMRLIRQNAAVRSIEIAKLQKALDTDREMIRSFERVIRTYIEQLEDDEQ
jgi:hypothetical protein